jgi:hypothetical protein
MTILEAQERLKSDPDFVYAKRFGYSVKTLLDRYPDGCPSHIIAGAMIMTEEEVEAMYIQTIVKLRGLMGVKNDEDDE